MAKETNELEALAGAAIVNTERGRDAAALQTVRWRTPVLLLWLALIASTAYAYLAHRELFEMRLHHAFAVSALIGGAVYLIVSCLRGFTLIPSTFVIVAALPFFRPAPLYLMTMVGIGVSASSLYLFSHLLGVDRLLERRHPARLASIKGALHHNSFRIIVGWSFFPFVPTDLICYACGSLKTGFKRFLPAVLIGEGVICAAYIFLGDQLLTLLRLR